ncbi:hypothetical protein AV656_11785 [Bhargavaea cecembensis]|uniref:Restriction endonuclease type IV Mrr domain-containing protein n=1 Tax=Bhargavaea cecembensis TaxID=394098 RepID=A0A165GQ37_9BACL|nr:restriction endonuclease [Bhargavaea cecembensis]KZE37245.1 hypothetical protein AV656_11785 [Bhargavaea cecembensis]
MKKKSGRRKRTDTFTLQIPPKLYIAAFAFYIGMELALKIQHKELDSPASWLILLFIIILLFFLLGLYRPFFQTNRIRQWKFKQKLLLGLHHILTIALLVRTGLFLTLGFFIFSCVLLLVGVFWICFRLKSVNQLPINEGSTKIDHVSLEDIDQMTGKEFETFLYKLYIARGYDAKITPHTDYGIDLVAVKDGIRTGIQAKCYGEGRTVGVAAVNEVCGGAGYWNVQNKVVITNRVFTKKAMITARSNNVIMIDRNDLQKMIDNYNKTLNSKEYIPPPSA